MKTVTFLSVYNIYRELCASGASAEPTEAGAVAAFARAFTPWARRGWRWFFWPDLMRLEERAVVDGVVSRMEEGKGEIDTVYSVFPDNPRERLPMRWRSLRWEEAAEGIVVGRPDQGGVVWVEYRLPPPRWEGAAWAGGSAYAEGCQVWFSDAGAGVVFEGDFWRARAGGAVAGESPASAPEKWECVGVPAFLADFGARGAYDVALRGDAQWARAAMEESAAWSWLYDERDNLQNAGGRVLRLRVPGCRM